MKILHRPSPDLRKTYGLALTGVPTLPTALRPPNREGVTKWKGWGRVSLRRKGQQVSPRATRSLAPSSVPILITRPVSLS